MLSFAYFEDRISTSALERAQKYLLGVDEVPVPAEFDLSTGSVLVCSPSSEDALALSVQIDLDDLRSALEPGDPELQPLGRVVLQTCQLPGRDRAYLLMLELARHRVMSFLNKLEDWQLFDLSATDDVMQRFDRAHELFMSALVGAGSPGDGPGGFDADRDRTAARALLLAHDAGQRLAIAQAERLWADRVSGRLYERTVRQFERIQVESPPAGAPILMPSAIGVVLSGRPFVGTAVSPHIFSQSLAGLVVESCDFVTMPMRWSDMEPEEGRYTFGPTDRWIEWSVRTAKIPVVAGPVVDFRPCSVPDWLYIWENDYETLRELVAEHVKQLVTRYRRTVTRWTAVSGLHVNRHFPLGFEQMMDLTRIACGMIRKLQPKANIVIELAQPWGEYFAVNRKSVPPQLYADMVEQAGVPFDAFGLRVQMGQPEPGQATRDLMSFSAMLDRFSELEKPLMLTAMGVPCQPVDAAPSPSGTDGDRKEREGLGLHDPGWWGEGWSEPAQADWLARFGAVALAKPFIHSICWQDLYDREPAPEMPAGGLISSAGATRQCVARLGELRRASRIGTWPFSGADPGVATGAAQAH